MRIASVALVLALAGCPQLKPGTDLRPNDSGSIADTGTIDRDTGLEPSDTGALEDAGMELDATTPDAMPTDATPPASNAFTTSSGGGTRASSSYRLRLSISPPTPVGTRQSASFKLFLGPVPVQAPQ